jgi:hypothetical protein
VVPIFVPVPDKAPVTFGCVDIVCVLIAGVIFPVRAPTVSFILSARYFLSLLIVTVVPV